MDDYKRKYDVFKIVDPDVASQFHRFLKVAESSSKQKIENNIKVLERKPNKSNIYLRNIKKNNRTIDIVGWKHNIGRPLSYSEYGKMKDSIQLKLTSKSNSNIFFEALEDRRVPMQKELFPNIPKNCLLG